MAQTINLAPGAAPGASSDIVVASGVDAIVGIYTEAGTPLSSAGPAFRCTLQQVTPGEPSLITTLDTAQPCCRVMGPGTYRVVRGAAGVPVGVFSEA